MKNYIPDICDRMKNYIPDIVCGIGFIALSLGALNCGTYNGTKDNIINQVIEGRVPPITQSTEPASKSPIVTLGGFGSDLAQRKFENGDFNEIIESHRD